MANSQALDIPEVGQAVRVRNRLATVRAVEPYDSRDCQGRLHIVDVEYLDDFRYPEAEQLLVGSRGHGQDARQDLAAQAWTPTGPTAPTALQAFVNAHRWTRLNRLRENEGIEDEPLLGVWNSAIQVHPYQLEPVIRALSMPRVSLLLADGVGFGKTIQCGLVLEELLLRRRIRRILVICPAMLQRQWKYELRRKFNLEFEVIDSDSTFQLRRRLGIDTNPWKAFPRIITSMDYLRMPDVLQQFLQASGAGPDAETEWPANDRPRSVGFADRGRVPPLRSAERQPGQPADPDAAGNPLPVRASHLRLGHAAQRQDRLLHRPAGTARPDPVSDDGRDGRPGQEPIWPRSASAASRTTSTSSRSGRRSPSSLTPWKCRSAFRPQESALYAALREYRKKGQAALSSASAAERWLGQFIYSLLTKRLLSCPYRFRPDVVAALGGRCETDADDTDAVRHGPCFGGACRGANQERRREDRSWKKMRPDTAVPGSAARAKPSKTFRDESTRPWRLSATTGEPSKTPASSPRLAKKSDSKTEALVAVDQEEPVR